MDWGGPGGVGTTVALVRQPWIMGEEIEDCDDEPWLIETSASGPEACRRALASFRRLSRSSISSWRAWMLWLGDME